MSTNSINSMVIVAIPDENDRIWKVSSEKIPHLTLLFLGDADKVANPESIMQFVEHAADRSICRFYLPVDRRDELGEAKADVLFFKKNRYDFKAVRDFRSLLLKDDNIKTAYDSTSQFEFPDHVGASGQPWIPHLTLGYPETPAKPIPDDYSSIYSVEFNKIAVWVGDYDGPEFMLRDYWDDMDNIDMPMDAPLSVAMSGVKGMRWGVRNEKSGAEGGNSETKRVALAGQFALLSPKFREHVSSDTQTKVALFGMHSLFSPKVRADLKQASAKISLDKADSQWDKSLKNGSAWIAVNNASADHFNKHIDALNNKYPKDRDWSKEDYNNPKDPGFKKYMKDINSLTQDSIKHAAKELDLKNPSGTKEVEIKSNGPGNFSLSVKRLQHAADVTSMQIKVTYQQDTKGRITGFAYSDGIEEDSMAQSDEVLEFLEHHGIKGMKWGVRDAAKSVGRGAKKFGRAIGDANFEAKLDSGKGTQAVESEIRKKASSAFSRDLPNIKAKPEYQSARKLTNRLRHPKDPATKAYRKEVKEAYINRLEGAANSMTNASGTRQYTVRERGWELPAAGGDLPTSKYYWDVTSRAIKHADDSEVTWTMEVTLDEDGFVTGVKEVPKEDSVAQTVDLGAEFLAHHGVKGMKWGQRKERGTPGFFETRKAVVENKNREKRTPIDVRVQDSIGTSERKKTTVSAKGGEDHPATPDAIRVAAATQKLKKSGLHALTNKELQEVSQRLNLETQVSVLLGKKVKKGPGAKFVEEQLKKAQNDPIKTFGTARRTVKTAKTVFKARKLAGSPV